MVAYILVKFIFLLLHCKRISVNPSCPKHFSELHTKLQYLSLKRSFAPEVNFQNYFILYDVNFHVTKCSYTFVMILELHFWYKGIQCCKRKKYLQILCCLMLPMQTRSRPSHSVAKTMRNGSSEVDCIISALTSMCMINSRTTVFKRIVIAHGSN